MAEKIGVSNATIERCIKSSSKIFYVGSKKVDTGKSKNNLININDSTNPIIEKIVVLIHAK